MRPPTYPEERVLFGALVGGAAWALWKFGLGLPDVAPQAGLVGAVAGALLGGYTLQLLLALLAAHGSTHGVSSESSRRIIEDRDDYFP